MLRINFVSWLACGLIVVVAGVAYAQRDAGAKARGEFGTGFWNSKYNRSSSASRAQTSRSSERIAYSRRSTPQADGYRVSSYEPISVAEGDTVAIAKDSAPVMRGNETVGKLAKGKQFKVLRVSNGWLGVVAEEEGQVKRGWVWHQDVSPVR